MRAPGENEEWGVRSSECGIATCVSAASEAYMSTSTGRRYITIVGTRVRERRYEASMAKTTARAIGRNSEAAGPVKNTTGTNTMQIASVETKAGTAICAAPSRIAC